MVVKVNILTIQTLINNNKYYYLLLLSINPFLQKIGSFE